MFSSFPSHRTRFLAASGGARTANDVTGTAAMTSDVHQGVLWSLRARRSTAKCVLHAEAAWTELVILQDEEVAFRESFPDEHAARLRAEALHKRLVEKGWTEAS
jgi:hypothetical protein